jgi:hypothetical protein
MLSLFVTKTQISTAYRFQTTRTIPLITYDMRFVVKLYHCSLQTTWINHFYLLQLSYFSARYIAAYSLSTRTTASLSFRPSLNVRFRDHRQSLLPLSLGRYGYGGFSGVPDTKRPVRFRPGLSKSGLGSGLIL